MADLKTPTWQPRKGHDDFHPRGPAETINHPAYYGGAENPYEAIKVIDAWGLGFCLGNTIKYIARAGKKGPGLDDLKKARWYLDHTISLLESDNAKD